MPTDHILALLIAERDKLNRAIEALGAPIGKRRGRPPGSKNGQPAVADTATRRPELEPLVTPAKRAWTPEKKAAARARAKAMWAKRKRAAKKS